MMEIMQLVWLGLVVLFVVLEAATVSVVSSWFALGSLLALVVALIWPGAIAAQVIVFVVVSVACLLALRPLVTRYVDNKRVPTNADANVGKVGQVVSEIQPGRFGRVKLEGLEWTAKSDVTLQVGSWCRVLAIEGVKLVVEPAETPQAAGAVTEVEIEIKE